MQIKWTAEKAEEEGEKRSHFQEAFLVQSIKQFGLLKVKLYLVLPEGRRDTMLCFIQKIACLTELIWSLVTERILSFTTLWGY